LTGDLQEPTIDEAPARPVAPPREPPAASLDAPPAASAARIADLEALRERLKARGVLTDAPAVVIPKEPRPEPAPGDPDASFAEGSPVEPHWAESPYDAWDVEPGPETVPLPCPRCHTSCTVPTQATRLTCTSCDLTWRFVVCDQCDRLDLTRERQESWRCRQCGHFSRAWWRTPSARLLALRVLARRREAMIQEQRRIVREGMRMRRWKLIAFGVVAALAAAVFVLATRAAEPATASGREVACSHFRSILEDVAAGRSTPTGLESELRQLELEAQGEDDLTAPVSNLLAARGPTAPEFIAARATLVDACGVAFRAS
jgi:hypothetical protein